jgi:hypothetical protein
LDREQTVVVQEMAMQVLEIQQLLVERALQTQAVAVVDLVAQIQTLFLSTLREAQAARV